LSQGGELPLYLVQVHGLVTAFLIMLMLQYRTYVRQKQQRNTLLALERSQLQANHEREVREDQEKLLAMLAHELKTPLATMQMRMDNSAPGSQEMRKAMRDMNAIIERCLQTVQLSDRQLQAHLEQVDLVSALKEAVASCTYPDRVQMQGSIHGYVQTDRQLLFIVLNNLLENACKYSAPESPIDIRLHSDGKQAQIDISNWPGAAGWPEPTKLFDKYNRGSLARRQAGTGLGLYLARNLMLVIGGSIDYQPDDQCIRFVLTLPIASDHS
jgi:signal transduction histidine kinase